MPPFFVITLAALLPFFFLTLILGPIYIGMCAGMYFFYQPDSLIPYIYNPNYILGIYEGFYNYFEKQPETVGFLNFFLPIYGPVLVGTLMSLLLVWLFARYVKSIFILE